MSVCGSSINENVQQNHQQHDPQLLFHHQLMGRSTTSLPPLLTPPGSPSARSTPSIVDPFGHRSSSPSPYHHALSYRPPSAGIPTLVNSSTLLLPQPSASSSLSSSTSTSPTSASSSFAYNSSALSPLPLNVQPLPSQGELLTIRSLSAGHYGPNTPSQTFRHSVNPISFDPDVEAERVRLVKLEMRRSVALAGSRSQQLPTRPSSSQSFANTLGVNYGRKSVRQDNSLRSRNSSRSQLSNGNQVYRPSPLRSASTPDLVNAPVVTDPKKRHQQLKEEYGKMRKERIEEERERMRLSTKKKKNDENRKSAWISSSVKSIRAKKQWPPSSPKKTVSAQPIIPAAVSDGSDVTVRSRSTETDSSCLPSTEVNESSDSNGSIETPRKMVISVSGSAEKSPPMKDPFRKSIVPGGGVFDEPSTPIKLKLARARQSKTLKKKISSFMDGFRGNPQRVMASGVETRIDIVDPKTPICDRRNEPTRIEAIDTSNNNNNNNNHNSSSNNSNSNNNNNTNWLRSLRIKTYRKKPF